MGTESDRRASTSRDRPEPGQERAEPPTVDVIFSPSEPILSSAAAQAVLYLLLHAYEAAKGTDRPAGGQP